MALVPHLFELHSLFAEAKGDHPALADVRGKIAEAIDAAVAQLPPDVDIDALFDEMDAAAEAGHKPGVCDCQNTAPQPVGSLLLSGPFVHWKDCPKAVAIVLRHGSV